MQRFSHDIATSRRCPEFAEISRHLLKENLEQVCLVNVQACILIAEYAGAQADRNAECLYFTIAARMAQMLHLDQDPAEGDQSHRETCRRVWWSCYMVDIWSSAGLGLARQLADHATTRLPMLEHDFQAVNAEDSDVLCKTSLGFWAYMVKLVKIFAHVQTLHQVLLSPGHDDMYILNLTKRAAEAFEQYQAELPSDMAFNQTNLDKYRKSNTARIFIALHLGYNHYATLLYFHHLDKRRSFSSIDKLFADRCKAHAAELSDIIKISMEQTGCEAYFHIVGHMTIISSSVLLHTLLFGSEEELADARERLRINFLKLIDLSKYWPGIGRIVSLRLSIFPSDD